MRGVMSRAKNEIEHGKSLAAGDPELLWGWATAAGRVRAERRARLIAEAGQLSEGKRVLEIGCGSGMFTQIFSRSGANITAVDISPDLILRARARGLPADKVSFIEKRFEDCDVDGPFDAVIGSSILHHLDLEQALGKILTLLKPGGVFSFAEPNMLNPQVFAERKFRRFFPYVSPDETAFIRWELKKYLSKAGYSQIRIRPFDWLHPAIPPGLIGFVSFTGKLLEKTPVLSEFAGSMLITAMRPMK